MTEAERLIWDDYLRNYPTDRGTTPPTQIPRTPAEWEEMQGVVITWASYTSNLTEIVRYAQEHVKVYIVCSNPVNVQNTLNSAGVGINNIEFVVADYNSVWVRDYGPQSIYLAGTNELAFVDWVYNRPRPADDVIPGVMATHMGLPLYQMTQNPNRLTATGGNFMTDGFDKGFSSNLILTENNSLTEAQINTIKKNYMGIDPYVKMTVLPYDGIHHIDMHMKLLDEETLLVGQYPAGVSDGPQIEANLNYILNNFQTPYGRPYRVVRIPMPPDHNGNYPNSYSNYLTYTNSIILNGLVLVPIYGRPQDDEALQIYRDAMPGYNVVGLNMLNVIPASGAIHCITREIAAHDPIFISHPPYRDEVDYSYDGYPVNAHISSAAGINNASLYWSTDTTAGFSVLPMTLEQDTFRAVIPNQSPYTKIYYYISATNGNNKTITKPLVAPAGLYVFDVGEGGLGFDFSASVTEIDLGDEVVFTYIEQGIEAQSYLWSFGEGASPATSTTVGPHTVTYETPGHKTVSLTINDEHTLTKQNYILVNEYIPTLYTLIISTSGMGTTSPEVGSYDFEEGALVTLTATPHSGWQFLLWELVNSETYTTPEIEIEIDQETIAIAYFAEIGSNVNTNAQSYFSIYPNPSTEKISITFNLAIKAEELWISNTAGLRVLSKKINSTTETEEVDISVLPSGLYIISIKTNEGIISSRFVKM